ncbi:ATP-binding protein [Candidatus Desantisbacteria bacterium]|nr:ATP-binding protein [Candidatus Desantisbacteria bacterium]
MKYFNRNITKILLEKLKQTNIIALTGARQVGKTTLCEDLFPKYTNLAHSYISFDDPDERLRFQQNPIGILDSLDTPIIILDEIQKIPSLFEPLKYIVDKGTRVKTNKPKIFILTGSSQLLLIPKINETLAGRISLLNLWPLSLSEVFNNNNTPLLQKIWDNKEITKKDNELVTIISPETMRSFIKIKEEHQKWGGYPSVWQKESIVDKINWLKDYRRTYLERDISDIGRVDDIDTFALSQKLLCARTGQLFSISEIARDLGNAVNTVKRYINLLSISFQCVLLRPYYENVGKRFIKSPKIYFPDVGLNKIISGEIEVTSDASYETWVLSELIKWKELQPIEPELYFYRTSAGMEIDFLIKGENQLLPIEVKSGHKVNYADAHNLEAFITEQKKIVPFGLIVYAGNELVEIRKNIWAVPDWILFGGIIPEI